jgi:hypothetical protein
VRSLLAVAVVLGPLAGYGGSGRPVRPRASRGQIPSVACSVPRSLAPAPLPQETGVYPAGPLLLVTGEDLAQIPHRQLRRPSGREAIAVLTGDQPVTVTVAGRLVTLSPPLDPPDDLWYRRLSDAGLSHGPLDVHRPPGRLWFGIPEVYPRVRVTAFFADGTATSLHAVDFLHAGFG